MKLLACIAALMLLASPATAAEGNAQSYFTQERFIDIKDKHELARSWAKYAAIYNTMSELFAGAWDSPAQADQFKQMGNGASLAVGITFVMDTMDQLKA